MKPSFKSRSACVVVLAAAWVVALASPAWAPRSWGLAEIPADCAVGDDEGHDLFLVDIQSFAVDKNGAVVAQGFITGDCAGVTLAQLSFETLVTVEDASCQAATLELADTSVFEPRDEILIDVELSEATIIIPGAPDDGRLRGALCTVARIHETAPARTLAAALNRLLG